VRESISPIQTLRGRGGGGEKELGKAKWGLLGGKGFFAPCGKGKKTKDLREKNQKKLTPEKAQERQKMTPSTFGKSGNQLPEGDQRGGAPGGKFLCVSIKRVVGGELMRKKAHKTCQLVLEKRWEKSNV